ncbi:antibiotic biosynthesis monooxygenase [Sulfitobacter sp. F26204]|uniref:putative quinol monooxygenase n=1 Tax=Sulfitobacter sp. F26204 TaxID=2996014 RepID=UPI00225E51F9|nr:antibiotic biosynthesis monooxygenase [Sulfitobacter sp. F26204]MCX7558601.1 antibiotic biosynthesis monooxygenase [Sulfitobacter sp. F26204]
MKLITVEASFSASDLDAAMVLFEAQADQVRAMSACKHYALYRKPSGDGIAILQHWETAAAFDAYRASDTFATLGQGLRPLMSAAPVTIVAEVDSK